MKTGIALISEERTRQINEEKWTAEHDDLHVNGQLAMAAACYATPVQLFRLDMNSYANKSIIFKDAWPFSDRWDKRRRNARSNTPADPSQVSEEERIDFLTKAGALIAAEIDRLLRAQASSLKSQS